MDIIGIEEHWTTPELTAALNGLPPRRQDPSLVLNEMGDHLERLQDIGDGRVAAMDEQGIAMHVLSVAPPATGPLDPADAVSLSMQLNDLAAEAVKRHPTRLRAMATLPMAEPKAVAGELERAAGLGLVGTMVYGRTGETTLDDPCYEDFFATAERLHLPVFIHPQIPPATIRQAAFAGFDPTTGLALSTFAWGWHIEAAQAALRLIARGTLDRYPGLQIVLGHWGELLMFWGDRMGGLTRIAGLQKTVPEYFRSNFFVTSSGMLNPALLRHTLSVTSADRLLFSTDYPFQHPSASDIRQFLGEFDTDQDRANFASGNARRLFGIA